MGKLRLCFQIFEQNPLTGQFELEMFNPFVPVLSNVISTSKQKISIIILDKINLECQVAGGRDVILFVKKLVRDQKPIYAKFYDNDGWFKVVKVNRIHYRVIYGLFIKHVSKIFFLFFVCSCQVRHGF